MNQRDKDRRIYVSNLSETTTADDLNRFFAQYGVVTGVELKTYRHSAVSTGCAYIQMESGLIAKAAIKRANDQILDNHQIRVMRVRNQ
jgi:RNA recognition motif-containing protein